jgi:hypothetical protein
MSISPVYGMPGVRAAKTAAHRLAFRGGFIPDVLPQGKVIDGAKSRDSGNTGDLPVLRPGLLMGKVTASGKYAPSILGVLQSAAAAAATSVTVTAAQAAEIVRRVGATGTLRFVGPPAANGTVATFTETYSAVNTTTGVVTVSALDAALVAGSFVCADDGTYEPLTLIGDGFGVRVQDLDGNDIDVPFAELPIAGVIDSGQLLPVWPSDTALQQWLVDRLSRASGGKFTFSHAY